MNRLPGDIAQRFRGELRENEPLAGHTSLRVGGPADWFAVPADLDDLLGLLATLETSGSPYLVIGGGYNLLVLDGGFRGVVISMERLAAIDRLPGNRIRAEAGVTNQQLARFCRGELLAGLEFLAMIPGTVGGALAVNAGAHGAAVMDRIARLVTWTGGSGREWAGSERMFAYRRHTMAPGEVILTAEFQLVPGDADAMDKLLADYRVHRQESQRVTLPNAGSFFKNPSGEQAWRLIDRAGLRGCRVGGAQVAEAHTNFLVNAGGATARDFLELAAIVKERVRETSGVELEEEVRIVGEDGASGLGTGKPMTREELKSKKIGVLMGGLSAEREVSLKSGAGVFQALVDRGYRAVTIDVGRDLAQVLVREAVEVAFVCLHGRYGEDGTVQGLLELLEIPYTGSGVLASALAMDKIFAKKVFAASGLTVAPYRVLSRGESLEAGHLPFGLPVVVKPAREGSSVGVSIVKGVEQLAPALTEAFRYDRDILVEQFIKGREIQVGILAEQAIGAIEIVPRNEFYDYEAKYTDGMATHIMPAPLPPDLYEKVLRQGEEAHRALGCSGYSRVDFLVTEAGDCFLLEVNTLPGMTALSLLPEIAQGGGIAFPELVERIACSAALKIHTGG